MAPARANRAYEINDWVLCFHGPLLYKAKIIDHEPIDPRAKKSAWQYKVHYNGWKKTYVCLTLPLIPSYCPLLSFVETWTSPVTSDCVNACMASFDFLNVGLYEFFSIPSFAVLLLAVLHSFQIVHGSTFNFSARLERGPFVTEPNLLLFPVYRFASMPRVPKSRSRKANTSCRWDDWVMEDRLRKNTEENNELAADLFREARTQRDVEARAKKVSSSSAKRRSGGTLGSERPSYRDSEDGSSSIAAPARGTKRGRDYDIEKASCCTSLRRNLQHDTEFFQQKNFSISYICTKKSVLKLR